MQNKNLPCFFNGIYSTTKEIRLSPFDLGFLRGYVVFDVMPAVNGKPFLWERHFERLEKSAKALNLFLPVSKEEFSSILEKLLSLSGKESISFRTLLSGGPSADGFVPEPNQETFLVFAEGAHAYPEKIFSDGVKILTLEYERPLPQVKLANHAVAIGDLPRRKESGAFETLYVKDEMVSECSQSNIFIVKDGKLITTWDNVLWGVTQGLVLELAEELGIQIEKRAVSLKEVFSADEVFVTGSSKRIVPVVNIDGKQIGSGVPGEMTKRLMRKFDKFIEAF